MRITQTHRAIILSGVSEYIDDSVDTYVFGSRLDDDAQGGGVDLLLISQAAISPQTRTKLTEVLEKYLRMPVEIVTHVATDEPSSAMASILAEARSIDEAV